MTVQTTMPPDVCKHPTEDRPIRIFFMADHLGHPNGRIHGGTTYFLNTIPALRDAGFELTVVFMSPPHPIAEKLEANGITPHFLSLSKHDLKSLSAFNPLLDGTPHDVVHLHSFKSHLAGRMAAHKRGIASVIHVHDHIVMKQPMRLLQRRLGPKTSALVGITESVHAFAQDQYNVPQERCHTVLYGVNLGPFANAVAEHGSKVRQELGVADDKRVITMAGRLNPDKGHPQLFEAMKTVVAGFDNVELWVAGDGEVRGDYEAQVKQLGLENHVRFLGQRGDMPAVYASSDFSVVPSMWEEGFGLVALEAAAVGRPVIAFETGGLPTIVRDDQSGVLVKQGDVPALANAVLAMLGDDDRRAKLAQGAQDLALTFTLDKHVPKMGDVYRQAIRFAKGIPS